jgi:DnaJ-class molecular chaperone
MDDVWTTLGIRSDASREEIDDAYRLLKVAFHPDKFLTRKAKSWQTKDSN